MDRVREKKRKGYHYILISKIKQYFKKKAKDMVNLEKILYICTEKISQILGIYSQY